MRYLVIFILALTLALPVAAQDFQKGLEAYKRGDYATALREWLPLAKQGHAGAQYNLGVMYDIGYGPKVRDAVPWSHDRDDDMADSVLVTYLIRDDLSELVRQPTRR